MNITTIDAAVRFALEHLDDGAKEEAKALSKKDFVVQQHFGFGLFIRNVIVYQNPDLEALRQDLMKIENPDDDDSTYWSIHDDDISSFILGRLWDEINS